MTNEFKPGDCYIQVLERESSVPVLKATIVFPQGTTENLLDSFFGRAVNRFRLIRVEKEASLAMCGAVSGQKVVTTCVSASFPVNIPSGTRGTLVAYHASKHAWVVDLATYGRHRIDADNLRYATAHD